MRVTCLFLLLGLLAHAIHLEKDDALLEPSLVEQVICTRDCDRPSVDCQYSAWSSWGSCWGASSCGGPYFVNRTRVVVVQAVAYGTPCTSQSLFESRTCTADEQNLLTSSTDFQSKCAIPCIQSAWVVKTPCSATQDTCPPREQAPNNARVEGRIIYQRSITQNPQYGGAQCGPNEKAETCYFDCRYDCQWGPWQNDGCELPCKPPAEGPGQNRQRQTRKIQYFPVNGGAQCTGESSRFDGVCANLANLPSCCPGCTEGAWGDWTGCSVTCGYGGTQRRTRQVTPPTTWYTNPAICGDSMPACGATEQIQECCQEPCAEDCRCGEWTIWSDCQSNEAAFLQCGEGKKTRTRICLPAQYGGKPCPSDTEEVTCVLPGCPVNCEVAEWTPFTTCPATCGIRLSMRRTRTVTVSPVNGGSPCPDLVDERVCPCNPCPEDCVLSPWGAWGDCSAPCGPGKRQRTRDVIVVAKNGGRGCDSTVEEADCVVNEDGGYFDEKGQWIAANKPCDVNCKVGAWSEWSGCTKSCTSDEDGTFPGVRTRTRTVTTPPQFNGVPCPATIEQQWCATQCCPVDMELSPWGDYSPCTATCGGGWKERRRSIVKYPRCGGRVSNEPLTEVVRCNEFCCSRQCVYHPYSNWSPCYNVNTTLLNRYVLNRDFVAAKALFDDAQQIACPVKGGSSYRTREVRINNPCGSCAETFQARDCSITCPVDCEMRSWGEWNTCDRSCGWGAQRRTRTVKTQNQNGGTPCPCTEDVRPCYAGPCCKDCVLTDWNEWEDCSKSCGSGTQSRRRYVNVSTDFCPELECRKAGLIETRSCNTQSCPAPCVMESWSTWSVCSSSCGLGFQHRTRGISSQGTGRCDWDFEEAPCNLGPCPVPCTYTAYSEWSPCPLSCLPFNHNPQNLVHRYRAKYRVSGSGEECPPSVTEEAPCDPYPSECPRLCIVTDWGSWSDCSSQYGWGERRRERQVVQQPTGGEICPQLYQIERCFHEPPSNNCTWSSWSDWGSCEASCRTATYIPTRIRERYLVRSPVSSDYTAANGGVEASVTVSLEFCASTGSKVMTEACNLPFCPRDCVVSKWSAWGPCVSPGVRVRRRVIKELPAYEGAPCPTCMEEVDHCTLPVNEVDHSECEVGKCVGQVEKELAEKRAAQGQEEPVPE